MEIGKENEGEIEKLASNSLVSSRVVLREDIDNLLDFIERLTSGRVRTSLDIEADVCVRILWSLLLFILESCNDEMSCISNEIHDFVQSLFHPSGVDMLVDRMFFHLLENFKSYISSHSYVEPSRVTTMTEDRFVELFRCHPHVSPKSIQVLF
ncbi:uncharacterized protein [Solanum tuberosum]|uniref:uncharacterized protein n=1 Tax=Solanum tuberosum TaxID=4113 RepID=UPI00073A0390|nr:PREDICTED: uncharacterized protein LOC107059100 [Solanum tuberosum]